MNTRTANRTLTPAPLPGGEGNNPAAPPGLFSPLPPGEEPVLSLSKDAPQGRVRVRTLRATLTASTRTHD